MKETTEQTVRLAAEEIAEVNEPYMTVSRVSGRGMKHRIACLITLVRQAMYPNAYATGDCTDNETVTCLLQAAMHLKELCDAVLQDGVTENGDDSDTVVKKFFSQLPKVAHLLRTDIRAAYDGDPAARSEEEIIYAYPSFEAVSIYRMAHLLYLMKVPMLPRMMTEFGHQSTGIDIHPGASIGAYFFIDHGTGVVIGETCVIGEHVKLYQGVTLGAKSFELNSDGNPVKGIKRHPNIGNHVVIYAGATILGGDTFVGDGAIIGGNVWLTHSIEAGQTVTNAGTRHNGK